METALLNVLFLQNFIKKKNVITFYYDLRYLLLSTKVVAIQVLWSITLHIS